MRFGENGLLPGSLTGLASRSEIGQKTDQDKVYFLRTEHIKHKSLIVNASVHLLVRLRAICALAYDFQWKQASGESEEKFADKPTALHFVFLIKPELFFHAIEIIN